MLATAFEHYNGFNVSADFDFKDELILSGHYYCEFQAWKNRTEKRFCFIAYIDEDNKARKLSNSYYVGVDWIKENERAIYIEPKLNRDGNQTDYLKMLFTALAHSEVANHTEDLFEVKWDKPEIKIQQQQDLLTPLLIVQFLGLVKQIIKKGLKKSYYKVEQNLHSKVKGKVLVGQSIKKNILNNKLLKTYCSYEEFGLDGLENRLLKKALLFVQRYLPANKSLYATDYAAKMFGYIMPAFESVSVEVSINDIKNSKTNAFYKEYSEAIRLAKIILQRFGYNINKTTIEQITTPPFWIDMSKLFELYVFGILKDEFKEKISFQDKGKYGYTDFLYKDDNEKIVIDAKYKLLYADKYDISDIRQLSGYARDIKVLELLDINKEEWDKTIPQCLIIYPDSAYLEKKETNKVSMKNKLEITEFNKFYKMPVKLPVIGIENQS